MRLNNTVLQYLSKSIAKRLVKSQSVEGEEEKIYRVILKVLQKDIELEKQIEEEAHRLLRTHIREIEAQGISYQKMFQMVKQKLAKERGLKL